MLCNFVLFIVTFWLSQIKFIFVLAINFRMTDMCIITSIPIVSYILLLLHSPECSQIKLQNMKNSRITWHIGLEILQ